MSAKTKAVTAATQLATREDVIRAVKKLTDGRLDSAEERLATIEAVLLQRFTPRPSLVSRLWSRVRGS